MDTAEARRQQQVRRNTLLLMGAQAALWGSMGAFAALTPVSVAVLDGREGTVGWLLATLSISLGLGARVAGRVMDRSGRRAGLVGGYILVCAAGLVSASAVGSGSLPLLFAGTGVLGIGGAAALLGRAAVADMYEPQSRGRAVGALVVAGTVGAVAGPQFGSLIHGLSGGRGSALAASWLVLPALGLVSLALVLALRPDPSALAVGDDSGAEPARRPRDLLRIRPALTATISIALAHATMNVFMGIVPLAIHRHGSGQGVVSTVVSFHLAGMFALSPWVGAFLDRRGRGPGLLAGSATMLAGVGLCSFGGSSPILALGLTLVGIGWSFCYLGSTAVVSDLARPGERARALGLVDLVTGLFTAAGVVLGTALAQAMGVRVLGFVVLALFTAPVVLQARLRETSPGRWEPELAA